MKLKTKRRRPTLKFAIDPDELPAGFIWQVQKTPWGILASRCETQERARHECDTVAAIVEARMWTRSGGIC